MPHMANMPWMMMYFLFNILLMLVFANIKSMSFSPVMNLNQNSKTSIKYKKWLW